MPVFTDQTGRKIDLPAIPQRIVSLVPSQTELLYDLGLDATVVGITKFCIHPDEWFRSKTRVGGTKQVKMEMIRQLQPDLIIANKEENVREQIEELQEHYPVWVSDVNDLPSAYQMIEQIGELTGKQVQALEISRQVSKNFKQFGVQYQTSNLKPRTVYLIWQDPYMTIGADTFIHAMLEVAGFDNLFGDRFRYPETTMAELKKLEPGLLLLSSEPFPFKQEHADKLKEDLPGTRIMVVDGEMFSWYGSRLQKAPAYFTSLQQQLATE